MKANEKATKMRLSKLVKHGIQLAMGPRKADGGAEGGRP